MIVKEKLAALPKGYCISLANWKGKEYCITASEDRDGDVLLIDTQQKRVQRITGLAGGVMSILPIPEDEGAFLAIQRFFPIFDSKEAEIVYCKVKAWEGDALPAEVHTVAKLPYVHRIALTGEPGARKIIAATLCHSKAYTEDWSQPGAVYEYSLNSLLQAAQRKTLIDGIHKNHGMYTYQKSGGSYTLVSGAEGVWALDAAGNSQKLCDEPVSDLCMFDVDGDGVDEMVCIAPFHGNYLRILKKKGPEWAVLAEREISFGHAVWSGLCGGVPVILCCSRGDARNTVLYLLTWEGDALRMEALDIDLDIGSTNIVVKEQGEGLLLYAANHGHGETARYTITL